MTRKTIDDLLTERHDRFTPLQRLLRRAQNQKAWTAELRAVLPAPLQRHCSVLDVRAATMFVVCGNASAATRLRFMAPAVVGQLNGLSHFAHLQQVNVRVSA